MLNISVSIWDANFMSKLQLNVSKIKCLFLIIVLFNLFAIKVF